MSISALGDRRIQNSDDCVLGTCCCTYLIDGVRAQLKPCCVFAECYCCGDIDPDWEYILRGACFGFKVIDKDCNNAYHRDNYGSITKGDVGVVMSGRLQVEIDAEF